MQQQTKSIVPATDFDLWQDGEITDDEFLEKTTNRLMAVQDSLEPLAETEKILKGHISLVVERQGGRASLPGIASFVNTAPALTVTYDAQQVDRLVAELTTEGHFELAQRLTACRKKGSRAGYLRITKAKGAPAAD